MLLRPAPQAEIARFPFDAPKERAAEAAGVGEGVNAANRPQPGVLFQDWGDGDFGGPAVILVDPVHLAPELDD